MSLLRKNEIKSQDSFSIDAFGRWRVSNPFTVFDSKQVSDQHEDLLWDNAETSGSGTTATYNANKSSKTLAVSASTAGTRVRQTKRRFNYQPGKSQEILITFTEFDASTGINKKVGYFDDKNGIFLQNDAGTLKITRRTYTSGSAVDNDIAQSSWNIDKMDGTGVSGITLDFSKSQIFFIDLEWLGVGRVRAGFVVDGVIYYVHEFKNTNNLDLVYMTTPNLPIRYEISNDGSGDADSFDAICASIISEGGFDPNGVLRSYGTTHSKVDADTSGTYYALIGLKLKSACTCGTIMLEKVLATISTADIAYWELRLNPTVAGTFTYSDLSDSILQVAVGDTSNSPSTNTVTGGTIIDAGYISDKNREANISLKNALTLGSKIDGTLDEIVLCVTPFEGDVNLDIGGGLSWREII